MRARVKSISAGERFSAIVLIAAFFSVIIPAAIEITLHHGMAIQQPIRD
jgi:hypothetical protein